MTTPSEDQISSNSTSTDNGPIKEESHEEMEDHPEDIDELNGHLDLDNPKRQRPRKRKVYASICKQIEFYFSDANIMKNRLMREKVISAEYTPLAMFLDFNRIKKETNRVEDLQKALVTSDKLELSSDSKGVKRKVPFDPKKVKSDADVEESTIYVENVPRHVGHEWLETIFQSFGPIAYISLPKFRNSHQPKGFAFIEFDTKESATGCLEAYKGEGACLPSDMDPAELMSIQTFSEEQEASKVKTEPIDKSAATLKSPQGPTLRKRRHEEPGKETPEPSTPKKVKFEDGSPDSNLPSVVDSNSNDFSIKAEEVEDQEVATAAEAENSNKTKRKRKRNKMKKTAEDKLEGDSIHLKVLTKKAWRQLRNRYLNLQRQNMSKLKKQLRDQYLREEHYKNCMKQEAEDPDFAKSHVIEILMDSPAESVDAFKKQIQVDLAGESEEEAAISGFIKYVDYEEGALEAYVRFGEDDCFTARIVNFVENAEKVFRSARILTVYEAKDYKDRVLETLKLKRKNLPRSKVRGKDRLLKAASKSGSHIRFDHSADEEIKQEVEAMDETDTANGHVEDNDVLNEPESTTA